MALKKTGHSAELFTYHLGRDEGPFPIHRTRDLPWYTKTSAGPSWHKLYIDVLLLKLLWQHRRRLRKFDVIHAHLHEGAWIGWWAKLFLKLPLILDAQGSLVGELEQHHFLKLPGLQQLFTFIEGWILHRADTIFTSSKATYELITTHYSDVAHKTVRLDDATSTFTPSPETSHEVEELRQLLHLNSQAPTVIYTGGLSAVKGIDYLLHAIPTVLKTYPDAQFIIAGYPKVDRCKRIAQELGVADSVRFTKRINYFDLPKYLQLADIGVDPKPGGAGESSGKALNYMAAGLPIVAFNSINAQAVMKGASQLVDDISAEALAAGICQLLNDPENRKRYSAAGQEIIQQQFSWNDRISIAIHHYEQLTSR